MKKFLSPLFITILNIALFIGLQILSQFVQFLVFGEGSSGDKFIIWTSLFFAIVQIMLLIILYNKEIIFKTNTLFVVNVIIIIIMYLYYAIL